MNRSERRFEKRLRRPSGTFVGELQRQTDKAAFQDVLRARMQEEANGAPIPGHIAERMTKPKPEVDLWQVGVTLRDTGDLAFLGPMMPEDAIRAIVADVNAQIVKTGRRDWTKAEAYPMTPISNGVN